MNLIRFDVIACAELATHLRMPFFDVPLKTDGRDGRRSPYRYQTDVFREHFAHLQASKDVVFTSKNEG